MISSLGCNRLQLLQKESILTQPPAEPVIEALTAIESRFSRDCTVSLPLLDGPLTGCADDAFIIGSGVHD
jgi:hypothetical protein